MIRRVRITTEEKVARRKLSLLDLTQELRNVSKACKVMGYSRQQLYEIRPNYQTYGSAGGGAINRLEAGPTPEPRGAGARPIQ